MPSFGFSTTGKEVVETFADRLKGKTILITGPSTGSIGAETAISLASANPSIILLLGRSLPKTRPVISKINSLNPSITTRFIQVDLASLASVQKAAAEINGAAEIGGIDVIINNAGIIARPSFELSEDGIEMQLASNHIGHFLLTNLVMGKLLKAGKDARVVNVSSTGFGLSGVRFEDWNFMDGKDYNPWKAYGQSKTANILFAKALADRLKSRGVQAFSVQPGYVPESNLSGHVTPGMWTEVMQLASERSTGKDAKFEEPKTAQQGCSTTLVAALAPFLAGESGAFLQDCVVRPIEQDYAKSRESVDRLWALSEKLVGRKFDVELEVAAMLSAGT